MNASVTFPDTTKDPDEEKKVTLNLFNFCASFWRPNELVELNEYVRPRKATGFAYQATVAGTTATREPVWPTVSNATITDGSVTWKCIEAAANGLNEITAPSAVSEPVGGIVISDVSVSESTKILATYSSGTAGQDSYAVFTFTLNGATRVARQRVLVRKR